MKRYLFIYMVLLSISSCDNSFESSNLSDNLSNSYEYRIFKKGDDTLSLNDGNNEFILEFDNKKIEGKYQNVNKSKLIELFYVFNGIETSTIVNLNTSMNTFKCAFLDSDFNDVLLQQDYLNPVILKNENVKKIQLYENKILKISSYNSILDNNPQKIFYDFYEMYNEYVYTTKTNYVCSNSNIWEIFNDENIVTNPTILKECRKGIIHYDSPQIIEFDDNYYYENCIDLVWYYMKKDCYIYNGSTLQMFANDVVRIETNEFLLKEFHDFTIVDNKIFIENSNIVIDLSQ